MLDKYARRQDRWNSLVDDDARKEFKKAIYNKWIVYLLMRVAD